MKLMRLMLIGGTFLIFAVAVAVKSAGFKLLGASPVLASEVSLTRNAILTGALYYLLTLTGIAAGVIFDAVGAVAENTRITFKFIRDALLAANSWRGLIASPLVFLTVYVGVKSSPISSAFVLLAFQNGFFWKSAMSRIMNDHRTNG